MSKYEQGLRSMHAGSPTTIPEPLTITDEELYERVARKAYELYRQRGEIAGHDLNDWLTAERLVRAELVHGSALAAEEGALTEEETA
jgi:predicted transcriptional regulator